MSQRILIIFVLSLCARSGVAASALSAGTYVVESTTIVYAAHHPLHAFTAKSSGAAKGKLVCNDKTCELLVAVPVKSFDSENGNRDAHMLKISRGAENPLATFRAQFATNTAPREIDGECEFGGAKHALKLSNITWSTQTPGQSVQAEGAFLLSDFNVDAPSLLGVPMAQDIKLSIQATLVKK